MRTDDEVRQIIDYVCSGGEGNPPEQQGAGYWLRQFAEEVIAIRQRIAELEKAIARDRDA